VAEPSNQRITITRLPTRHGRVLESLKTVLDPSRKRTVISWPTPATLSATGWDDTT